MPLMRPVDLSFALKPHFRWKVELQQRASTKRDLAAWVKRSVAFAKTLPPK